MTQTLSPPPATPSSSNGLTGGHTRHARRRPPRPVLVVLVLALVAGGAALWLNRTSSGGGPLVVSGFVEVDEVSLAAETAGRVADLTVDEGSPVLEGQIVGRLADPVLDVQSKQAVADAAQHQLTQAQVSRLDLRAPLSGVVQKRIAHRGEFVQPGSPILTVADPSELKLKVFVLEADLGRVRLAQRVILRADALPERVFEGQVRSIANRAEFTPRNVQTQKDRANLVFAVTVRVRNPDGALKAGLPVDATFDQ